MELVIVAALVPGISALFFIRIRNRYRLWEYGVVALPFLLATFALWRYCLIVEITDGIFIDSWALLAGFASMILICLPDIKKDWFKMSKLFVSFLAFDFWIFSTLFTLF